MAERGAQEVVAVEVGWRGSKVGGGGKREGSVRRDTNYSVH